MLGSLNFTEIVIFFVSILIAMTFHEAMHGYVAYWLGDTTALEHGRLTFNPLKSIDVITTIAIPVVLVLFGLMPFFAAKPVPINPRNLRFGDFGSAIVALAGPFSNLFLAIISGLIYRSIGINGNTLIQEAIILFTEVNVGLFIFNMIPFPPLDGSRLLYALAPEWFQEIMLRIESFGFMAILIFMLLIFQFVATPISNIEIHLLNILLG
jgi:Zn-dependent protease